MDFPQSVIQLLDQSPPASLTILNSDSSPKVTIARWESGEQAPRGKRLAAIQSLAQTIEVVLDPAET